MLYKAELAEIKVIISEESYTSKVSALSAELLHQQENAKLKFY